MTQDPDYLACEAEDLAHGGAVQPQGGLLLCDPAGERILAASVGLAALLRPDRAGQDGPRPADRLAEWLAPALIAALRALPADTGQPRPIPQGADAPAAGVECQAHRTAEGILVEWLRPSAAAPHDLPDRMAELAADLAATLANPFLGAHHVAQGVAAVAGYDRVMVYRFHPDWSGEVIAEARRPELPPFLGLRYPASDIPAQARALYCRNLLRMVADVQDVALPVRHAGTTPPDLGMAMLRAVSPIHIQYLRNMGVRATLTVSLLHRGRLWGMIACHHGAPRFPPLAVRAALGQAAGLFGSLLDRVAAEDDRRRDAAIAALRRGPGQSADAGLLARLLLRHDGLAGAAEADGIAWVGEGQVISVGLAPDIPTLRRLAAAGPVGAPYAIDRLGLPPPADAMRVEPAGMLAAALPGGGWLALFRREVLREVHWAGDPAKPLEPGPRGPLSPRRSFALWREQISGACRSWGTAEHALLAAAMALLGAAPVADLAALAAAEVTALASGDASSLHSLTELLAPQATAMLLDDAVADVRLVDITPALCGLLGVSAPALRGRPWPEVALLLGIVPAGAGVGLTGAEGEIPDARMHLAFSLLHGPLTLRLSLESALQHAGPSPLPLRRFDVLLAEDETRHGRLAAALRAAALQVERTRRAREALLRNASHELLTPLHAILGFAGLLADAEDPLPEAASRGYAAEIVTAGRAMQGLVENLLAVSRLEAGRLEPRRARFDLAALLRREAAMLEPLFAAKAVRLNLALPDAAPALGDASMLAPAVLNLLSNALKFTPANGEVACRLTLLPGHAEIAVADGGPGIAPEDRQRVFDAFEQGDGSLRRRHGGAGLGLYIARNMVELLGGSLALDASHAGGSVFLLRLPIG